MLVELAVLVVAGIEVVLVGFAVAVVLAAVPFLLLHPMLQDLFLLRQATGHFHLKVLLSLLLVIFQRC